MVKVAHRYLLFDEEGEFVDEIEFSDHREEKEKKKKEARE